MPISLRGSWLRFSLTATMANMSQPGSCTTKQCRHLRSSQTGQPGPSAHSIYQLEEDEIRSANNHLHSNLSSLSRFHLFSCYNSLTIATIRYVARSETIPSLLNTNRDSDNLSNKTKVPSQNAFCCCHLRGQRPSQNSPLEPPNPLRPTACAAPSSQKGCGPEDNCTATT